jgi:aquaporin Z
MLAYLVEAVGTFILLAVILNASSFGNMAPLTIGLALTVAIAIGGAVSGGHFNPVVTLVMFLKNQVSQNDALMYVVAQVVGAVAAQQMKKLL